MIPDLFTRARVVGVAILLATFGLGIAAGHLLARRPHEGVRMMMTTTNAIPAELLSLGLTEAQQQQVREILAAGRPRVLQVLEDMEPRMRAALQATETDIEGVLDASQLARWKEFRRLNPPRTERRFIER